MSDVTIRGRGEGVFGVGPAMVTFKTTLSDGTHQTVRCFRSALAFVTDHWGHHHAMVDGEFVGEVSEDELRRLWE
jgi:hypothetical protein